MVAIHREYRSLKTPYDTISIPLSLHTTTHNRREMRTLREKLPLASRRCSLTLRAAAQSERWLSCECTLAFSRKTRLHTSRPVTMSAGTRSQTALPHVASHLHRLSYEDKGERAWGGQRSLPLGRRGHIDMMRGEAPRHDGPRSGSGVSLTHDSHATLKGATWKSREQ
jgi:hypothetical protein